ncbi:MAG: hypothetical protein GF346_09650 [Candidatus Eisenbacteria bacterium]|nr:hypothetical protein [Candidatus Latescibacterota bacterium]MBD3302697.1 hypothetical protein [Candidatus Eisenbacteria bacterium]
MKKLSILAIGILLALGVASCGTDTVQAPETSAVPELVNVDGNPNAAVPLGGNGKGGNKGGKDKRHRAWQSIDPTVGGTLTAGRYSIEVPAGALDHTMVYSVTSKEQTGYVICELGPHGVSFDVPVTLRIDLSDLALDPDEQYTVYWFDEESGEWTDVGGTYDPSTGVLEAELEHFSRYGAGRAGW